MPKHEHHRPLSVHILADAKLANWPKSDKVCTVDYKAGWSFNKWVSALRSESVRVKCHTVILYLEKTQEIADVPPLKNHLHTICKILRQHNRGICIFVSNFLPRIPGTPLGRAPTEVHFMLLQAVHSVNRAVGKVHYLSTYEHFVSSKNHRIIRLTHHYFRENGQLTHFGCMILRECFLREAGPKSYWF